MGTHCRDSGGGGAQRTQATPRRKAVGPAQGALIHILSWELCCTWENIIDSVARAAKEEERLNFIT